MHEVQVKPFKIPISPCAG